MIGFVAAVISLSIASGSQFEAELLQCRELEDAEIRLACYDRLVDEEHRESPSPTRSETVDKKPVTAPITRPDSKSLFGTKTLDAKRIVEASLEIDELDHIEASVEFVERTTSRKLIMRLDNEQVWRQLDGQRMQVAAGDKIVIRKASLGSFILKKKGGSRGIRVRRTQ